MSNNTMTRVAAIQMVSTADLKTNLDAAAGLIASAVASGARLVVLPENFPLMGRTERDKVAIREPFGSGPIHNFLSSTARAHGIWLVGGTIPLEASAPDKIRAASLLYDDQGVCVARYDKIHLFDVMIEGRERYQESATIEPGGEVVVTPTPFGRIGLSVCYDLRFPELFRSMLDRGVEIITIPSAFTATTGRVHWEALLKARAVENLCFVIAPNQGGRHANERETHGHSMILDPWGQILARVESGPGVAWADIDLQRLRTVRSHFPALAHRRLDYARA